MDTSSVSGRMQEREKLAYFCINAGNIPVMSLLSGFLSIYYVSVVGLELEKVATMFLAARLFDAFTDPFSGFLIDKLPARRCGKFRPVLVLGVLVCMLNYVFVWLGPTWADAEAMRLKYVIAYTSFLLLGWTFDIMDIPLNSLLPVMTDDVEERRKLAVIKNMGVSAGALAVGLIAPLVVGSENAGLGDYRALVLGVMTSVLVLSLAGVAGIRERVHISRKGYRVKDLLGFLKVGPALVFFLVDMLVCMAAYVNTTSFPYFFKYVVGDGTRQTAVSAWAYAGTVMVYLAIFLGAQKKLGNRVLCAIGLFINGACFAGRFFAAHNLVLFTLLTVLGTAGTFSTVVKYSIQADNTNYVEYVTGLHGEGGIASLSSFISKAGQAIGGALPGYILAAAGFAAEHGVQSAAEERIIAGCVSWIPGLILALAGCLMLFGYKLSPEKLTEVNEAIRRKHENEAKSL